MPNKNVTPQLEIHGGLPVVQTRIEDLLKSSEAQYAETARSPEHVAMMGELAAFKESEYSDLSTLHLEEEKSGYPILGSYYLNDSPEGTSALHDGHDLPDFAVPDFFGVPGDGVTEQDVLEHQGVSQANIFKKMHLIDPDLPKRWASIYGWYSLSRIALEHEYGEEKSFPMILANYEAMPTPVKTYFFRETSLRVLAEDLAGEYQFAVSRPLRIAEIGCSDAEETWSIAAYMKGNGVEDQIDGFDISEEELALAREAGPYTLGRSASGLAVDKRIIKSDLINSGADPDRYLPYFHENDEGVSPDNQPVAMADFHNLNIITEKLDAATYDVATCFNLIMHYKGDVRERIIANILHGLRPGGIFIFDGPAGRVSGTSKEYKDWVEAGFERFGLYPHPNVGEHYQQNIYIYKP